MILLERNIGNMEEYFTLKIDEELLNKSHLLSFRNSIIKNTYKQFKSNFHIMIYHAEISDTDMDTLLFNCIK